MHNLTGQNIKGYELRELIGEGGFGVVYKAYQVAVEREVAIKVILPNFVNQAEFIRSFEAEARLVARLEHPHIVPLYDFWREPDGAYLVMRYFPASLQARLDSLGKLPPEEVVTLLDNIAGALTAAHNQRVIHRDLKPENIMLDGYNNAYLTDFGIASHISRDSDEDSPGRSFTGSLGYAPPELIRGKPPSPQSDIYSLGHLIYRILGGIPILNESSGHTINNWVSYHLYENLTPIDGIPESVFKVLEKATAKEKEKRHISVLEFAGDFRTAVLGKPSPADIQVKAQVNPYKGLQAFEESDAVYFFGRKSLTDTLISRLQQSDEFARFLAIIGASGSGKSSLVRAGLIPALRKGQFAGADKWFFATMTPGLKPFEKLTSALLSVATGLIDTEFPQRLRQDENGLTDAVAQILPPEQTLFLFIDQFEELFILNEDKDERYLFLQSLYKAVTSPNGRLIVVITMRADFYDYPLRHENFARLIRHRTEVITPFNSSELERAIVKPAEQVSLKVEPAFLTAIVTELSHEPGSLPLLQYTLTEAFERRKGNALTLAAYQASGGVHKALGRRAEALYDSLEPESQKAARQLFLRLVTPGEGVEDVRRRVLLSEVYSLSTDRPQLEGILEIFGRYRLLTFDHDLETREPSVEIAHEALLWEWSQFHTWCQESRNDLYLQRLLATYCRDWLKAERKSRFLLSEGRLSQFEVWHSESNIALTQEESDFLQASIAERTRQLELEQARQAREKMLENRGRTRLQILAVVLALGIVAAAALALLALNQNHIAQDARRESEKSAETSHEIALLTHAQLALYRDRNTDLAIALAIEAHHIGNLPTQEFRVLSEVIYAPGTHRVFGADTGRLYRLDVSPDGKRAIVGAKDFSIRLWDIESGAQLQQFDGHEAEVYEVLFSPDEKLIASASLDHTARIWDLATGETLHILHHDGEVMAVAFSPDGKQLITGSFDTTARIWDVETGELLHTLGPDNPETEAIEGHSYRIWGVTYSPDGQYVLTASQDSYIIIWDAHTGELLREIPQPFQYAYDIFFSADGQTFYTASFDNIVRVFDFETGEQILTLEGHTAAVYSVSLSPDGKTALTASQDKTIRLWDLTTGKELQQFIGHADRVIDVHFLPASNIRHFISSSYDGTLRLWDIDTDETIRQYEGHEGTVLRAIFNADGSRILSAAFDGTVRLWDTQTGETLHIFGADNPETEEIEGHVDAVTDVAFSPDEKLIVSGSYSGYVYLWDVESGQLLHVIPPDNPDTEEIEGHSAEEPVWTVTFTPDGKNVLSGAFDNYILQWDVQTGEMSAPPIAYTDYIVNLTFLPDGKRFLSGSWDFTTTLWNLETQESIRQYAGHTGWIWQNAVSPNGKTFLSASADSTMILWDIETASQIRLFTGHDDSVLSVTFNHDGQQAFSAGRDNLVLQWNIQTGEWLRRFHGHTDWVRTIDYHPTENMLITGGSDATLRLWQVQTLDEMIAWAKENRYVRELTCEERELYLVEPYCPPSE